MPWPVACKPSPGMIKKVTGGIIVGVSALVFQNQGYRAI